MPLLNKIKTKIGELALWEITESANELAHQFQFSEREKTEYEQINSEGRKKEFLAARILLKELLGCKTEIYYSNCGKPFLHQNNIEISISHCRDVAAVLLSNRRVGIDVEDTKRNIDRVAKRFLHTNESTHIEQSQNPQIEKVLYWGAKEAIFKCSKQEGIQFNEQIFIHPFKMQEEGEYSATLTSATATENFKLWYFFHKNNVITYCVEKENE